jgi:hypothetical protein
MAHHLDARAKTINHAINQSISQSIVPVSLALHIKVPWFLVSQRGGRGGRGAAGVRQWGALGGGSLVGLVPGCGSGSDSWLQKVYPTAQAGGGVVATLLEPGFACGARRRKEAALTQVGLFKSYEQHEKTNT